MANRLYGSLDDLSDSEQRQLRPIGIGVQEAAARTGSLLTGLPGTPRVRLFAGVRVCAALPPIAFVVSAGLRVLLVESVAWPAGAYTTTPAGRVLCDGTYIGQSVRPLLGSVRRVRRLLRHHQVAAVVVVHPCGTGTPSLPAASPAGPAWLAPEDVRGHLARRLRLRHPSETYCQSDVIS